MSGTSLDAIDAVLVHLEGQHPKLLATHSHAFPKSLRKTLLSIVDPQQTKLQLIATLDRKMGLLLAQATLALISKSGASTTDIQAIGSHGQTLCHCPDGPSPFTVQIGDPNLIAEKTGITTISDMRRRDMAAGGQGAPLVPLFHNAVFRRVGTHRCILNIGGIANITVLSGEQTEPIQGLDTGPGNGLLDAWINQCLGRAFDQDGAWGASGTINQPLLQQFEADLFFSRPPPKSTGREYFSSHWLQRQLQCLGKTLPAEDIQRTLVELSTRTISQAIGKHAGSTTEVYVCGGGAQNGLLMAGITEKLPDCQLATTAELGIAPDWVEAVAFAWLAQRTLRGQAGNAPAVTGASREVILGGIYPGAIRQKGTDSIEN